MSTTVISVEHLSKIYRLGQIGTGTLSYDLNVWWAKVRGKPNPLLKIGEKNYDNREVDVIWALKDICLSVDEGEVLGIIGLNGAGKSTLLKILSRVTAPTSGVAKVKGRIASLLEVGTGFHPDLTGRENIYLNGAILGMTKEEVRRKFDEIVAFSEVEEFIDTPVKRYSSGMYVRLAFAVAAHLESEILVVDEVLAVGDTAFQKKCLGKMGSVTKEGRTVLFVSHNMGAVKSLCHRAILLNSGRISLQASVHEAIDAYLVAGNVTHATGSIPNDIPRIGSAEARLRQVELQNLMGVPISQVYLGQPLQVLLTFEVMRPITDATIEATICSLDGTCVATAFSNDGNGEVMNLQPGWYQAALEVTQVFLPQAYTLDVGIHRYPDGATIDFVERTLDFNALGVAETGSDRYWPTTRRGFVRPAASWRSPKPVADSEKYH